MCKSFDEMQKLGEESANAATKSFGVVSKGVQAIATEVAIACTPLETTPNDFVAALALSCPSFCISSKFLTMTFPFSGLDPFAGPNDQHRSYICCAAQ